MTNAMNRITRDNVETFKSIVQHKGLQEIDQMTQPMDLYQRIATKSAIYPGQGTPLGLAYCALKLNGEAGELAEHVGKAMRDDNLMEMLPDETGTALRDNTLEPERRALIIKEIGDCLWYLSALCNELGITLSETALTNLEKLCDRGERDVLRGSGDER